LKDSK